MFGRHAWFVAEREDVHRQQLTWVRYRCQRCGFLYTGVEDLEAK